MSSVITLNGENIFELEQALREYTNDFIKREGDFSIERINAEDSEFSRLHDAIHGVPFLADKKLIILKGLSKNKKMLENFEHILTDVPDSSEVVLIEPKLDKRSAYYKYVKSKTDFRLYDRRNTQQLSGWLVSFAKAEGGTISTHDATYLIARVGENQLVLKNEIQKLILFDERITEKTIDILTEQTPQSTIFNLLETAFAGDRDQVFALYREQRDLKVEPSQIIAMLTWQLYILSLLKTAGQRTPDQIAHEAKLNPYVIRKSLAIARRLTLSNVKQLIHDLVVVDTKLKRTSVDADDLLQVYLLGLVSQFNLERQ